MRYLYRWHIDESDIDRVVQSNEVVFWVREIKIELDENDNSRFAAVTLPQFRLEVRLKKADYAVPGAGRVCYERAVPRGLGGGGRSRRPSRGCC